jgi:amino acid adenylation domain-containing protein/non-ribosomal peptide synthase protein (TIGR01720 family)
VAKFDLMFSAVESAGKIKVGINYATELYEQATIERMAGHFRAVVEEISRNADSRIGEITILSDAERAQLEGWNRTEREYPQRCAHELFEDQAAACPDSVALVCEDLQMTYAGLNERASQLARYLRTCGVGPEVRVALCVERNVEMIVGLLGILKAGGCYLPLDPKFPTDRLAYMLENAQAGLILTQGRLQRALPSTWVSVICLDTQWDEISQNEGTEPGWDVGPDNLAYVIYTSGSTGEPKGVAIAHRQIVQYTLSVLSRLEPVAGSNFVLMSTFAADLGNTMLFPSLCGGGTLHVIPDSFAVNPPAMMSYFSDHVVDCLKITPTHLSALMIGENAIVPERHLVIGGEAFGWEWTQRLMRAKPACQVWNHYGPTESTVGVLMNPITEAQALTHPSVPIGKPLDNVNVYVVGWHGVPTPLGVPGELCIGGTVLARGYLNHPDATAERFVPDPFSKEVGARLYCTGDLVRWRGNGNLEYLGRTDEQVKIRGYRVELGEIETLLKRHPGVEQCAVALREDGQGAKQVVAYIVPAARPITQERYDRPTDLKVSLAAVQKVSGDLRRFVEEKLPYYMVPSAFVIMNALPLTANGKLDRKALPEPEWGGEEAGYQEPQGEVEQVLADIWEQVLRIERVGREDNFFELGGDSILSIKVVARAMEAGIEITVQQMFQHQRLRELAGASGSRQKGQEVEGEEEEVRGEVELTAIQRWFFEQELEARHHFNQALLLSVRSDVDGRRLAEAVEAVLKHHDAVRLRYWCEEGQWKQRYEEGRELEGVYRRIDLSGVEREKRKERMEEICGELQRSLDLERGPLVRVAYFELGDGESGRLLWVMHHLIVDGVSWRILLEDMHTALEQLGRSGEVKLPEKTASLRKWVAGLKEWTRSGELTKEESGYWLSLKERANGKLPRDYEGGRGTVGGSERVMRELGEKETAALLRELPRRYQVQMQEALLTALVGAAGEWTQEEGVLVEMEGHGREAVPGGLNVTRTVGWFTTHFPVWLPVRRGMDVERRMEGVQRAMTQVPRNGIGYGLLRYFGRDEMLRKELGEVPQAEISFNYLGQLDEALPEESIFAAAEEQRGAAQDERQKRSHVLGLLASISNRKMRIALDFSREVHRRETVENLAASFMATLSELASLCLTDSPKLSPADFPMAKLNSEQLRLIAQKVGKQAATQKT